MTSRRMREIMKAYGITYAEMGVKLNRSPATVKQRLDTTSTFHRHASTYEKALNECIEDRKRKLEEL